MGTRSVTITSESEARAVISELTVMAATLRSAAMGDAMAESATREHCRSVAADMAAQERQLEALRRERALRAQAVVTQSQRAGEAEKHYGTMAATMASIFGPAVVGAVDVGSAGASAAGGRGSSDGMHAGSGR
jgi:septal ring-binding cell division protein DamX